MRSQLPQGIHQERLPLLYSELNELILITFFWHIAVPLSSMNTEKNDSLNLLNFFKVSGRNQFILATFK